MGTDISSKSDGQGSRDNDRVPSTGNQVGHSHCGRMVHEEGIYPSEEDLKSRAIRWFFSALGAVLLTITIILPIVKSIRNESVEEIPVLLVDYLEMPPEKKKEPEKVVRKKTQPKEEITRQHSVQTPTPSLSKSEDTELTEETLIVPRESDSAEVETPAPGDAGIVSVNSPSQLDNVSYEPMGHCPKPKYPSIASRAGITGFVDVELLIDENGRVGEFSLSRVTGHPAFGLETAKVLPKWRFPPPRMGGRKVRIRYSYRVNFRLD